MPEPDLTPSSPAAIKAHLDIPRPNDLIYDETIFLSGWVYAAEQDSPLYSVRAYLDETLVGETHTPFARPDVSAHLGLSSSALTGFRILGRVPGSAITRSETIVRIIASWGDGAEYSVIEQPVTVIPARLSERAHGTVIDPANSRILHREDIYGSGPPIAEPSEELLRLLQSYLPKGSSVVDVGCGAGAYGPE